MPIFPSTLLSSNFCGLGSEKQKKMQGRAGQEQRVSVLTYLHWRTRREFGLLKCPTSTRTADLYCS